MIKILIFGGTTEGRQLSEICAEYAVPAAYFAATSDGGQAVRGLSHITIHEGRLDTDGMIDFLEKYRPLLVFDATHPYAKAVSVNITKATEKCGVPIIRINRKNEKADRCLYFDDTENLLSWLENREGNIFLAAGSSLAKEFTKISNYQSRIWIRILPNINSLSVCLDLGYLPNRIICMQGPFSEELNRTMFKTANARILVTKDSGKPGGFFEKINAAKELNMKIAVIRKPKDSNGISLEEAAKLIVELAE